VHVKQNSRTGDIIDKQGVFHLPGGDLDTLFSGGVNGVADRISGGLVLSISRVVLPSVAAKKYSRSMAITASQSRRDVFPVRMGKWFPEDGTFYRSKRQC